MTVVIMTVRMALMNTICWLRVMLLEPSLTVVDF